MDPPPGADGPFYLRGPGGREILFPSKDEYYLSLMNPSRVDSCQFRDSIDHEQYLMALELDPSRASLLPIPEHIFPAAVWFRGEKVWFWTAAHYVRAHMVILTVAEVQYLKHPRHQEYVSRLSAAFSSSDYTVRYNQLLDRLALRPLTTANSYILRAAELAAQRVHRAVSDPGRFTPLSHENLVELIHEAFLSFDV